MLKVWLFGSGEARYFDRPLPGCPNQQSFLLLSYLLLNRRRPMHRERIAAVFWGEHPTSTSRKYLRNALWRLRLALQSAGAPAEEYLAIGDDSISFLASSRYWLDVEFFETTIRRYQGLSGQELTGEQAEDLEEAVKFYAGELLEGVYEDWCLYDRERYSLLLLKTLSKLMIYHGLHGNYERGLAHGERILNHDDTREKIYREMMWLYWLSGDRHAALAQFKRCAQVMRETLGISPMDETRRLYQQMLHGKFDPHRWVDRLHGPNKPPKASGEEAVAPLAEHALVKLHQLQVVLEETNLELQRIERLLSKTVLENSEPS